MGLNFNDDELKRILVNELGYCGRHKNTLDQECARIRSFDSRLQKTLTAWLNDRTIINDAEVEGVNISKIIARHHRFFTHCGGLSICNFIEALSVMSCILKNPRCLKNERFRYVFFDEKPFWMSDNE